MRKYLSILAMIMCAASTAPADVTIVRNSSPQAVIVLPDTPNDEERLSAERLQYYVDRITGVAMEIVAESDLPDRSQPAGQIHIGATVAAAGILEDLKQRNAPPEASLVVSEGNTVFVTGVDPIGTLHATYFLLEDFGVRWYIPAEWGTVIPQSAELIIEDQSTYRAPSFAMRTGLTHATTNIDADASWAAYEWGRGNHLGGWRWWGAGHSYRFLIPKENFKDHPEWFSLVDGKRSPDQLCISNPEGRAFALETVRKALATYGDNPPELICISPDDTRAERFCQCEGCQQFVPTRPDGTKDFSEGHDRIIAYANFFADALRDEFPNSRVLYMVDYHSHGFPSIVKPADNSAFWVIHWTGDQFHGQDDSTSMGRALTQWSRFDIPKIVYTYWGSHTSWSFWPVVHTMRKELPYYASKGVVGACSETHENWGAQHLNFIVYPRLMWDVNTDVDAWVSEFCEKFYGEQAARPMREYYALLEKAAQAGPPQFKYRQTLIPTFTPQVLSGLRQKIEQAERIIQSQDEIYQKRFAYVKAGFDTGDLYFSAEHLMRTFLKTKDPTIRPRLTEMMARALALAEDPQFKNLTGVAEYPLVDDIRKIYEQYKQGTTFAPGEFKYFEDYYLGGRTFIDAASKQGFIDDQYGLSLDAGATGTLVYRFDVREGVFETTNGSLVLTTPTKVNPLKLSVRASEDQPWTDVTFTGDGTSVDFDLSAAAKDQSKIDLKIELTNSANQNAHVLHQLHVNGRVACASEKQN